MDLHSKTVLNNHILDKNLLAQFIAVIIQNLCDKIDIMPGRKLRAFLTSRYSLTLYFRLNNKDTNAMPIVFS